MNRAEKGGRLMINIGRAAIFLSLLALIAAWISQVIGAPFLGLSQAHLFGDAAVLSLLGIAFLIDGLIHRQGL